MPREDFSSRAKELQRLSFVSLCESGDGKLFYIDHVSPDGDSATRYFIERCGVSLHRLVPFNTDPVQAARLSAYGVDARCCDIDEWLLTTPERGDAVWLDHMKNKIRVAVLCCAGRVAPLLQLNVSTRGVRQASCVLKLVIKAATLRMCVEPHRYEDCSGRLNMLLAVCRPTPATAKARPRVSDDYVGETVHVPIDWYREACPDASDYGDDVCVYRGRILAIVSKGHGTRRRVALVFYTRHGHLRSLASRWIPTIDELLRFGTLLHTADDYAEDE